MSTADKEGFLLIALSKLSQNDLNLFKSPLNLGKTNFGNLGMLTDLIGGELVTVVTKSVVMFSVVVGVVVTVSDLLPGSSVFVVDLTVHQFCLLLVAMEVKLPQIKTT